jgi:signal transduction histidine kinase
MRKNILRIREAGERGAALTRQLLAFSRKQVLQTETLNLNRVITDVREILRRMIGEDIDLQTVLSPALEYVKADRGQIEQVLMNLAVNARDAMPQGGRLKITTKNVEVTQTSDRPQMPAGEYVMLMVTDSGLGMDAETQAQIFEPFFTTKGSGKGTGLGLATV